jgi:hypothetical protein
VQCDDVGKEVYEEITKIVLRKHDEKEESRDIEQIDRWKEKSQKFPRIIHEWS